MGVKGMLGSEECPDYVAPLPYLEIKQIATAHECISRM
jgi:hypothetical protein